jgi:hypothetical protein
VPRGLPLSPPPHKHEALGVVAVGTGDTAAVVESSIRRRVALRAMTERDRGRCPGMAQAAIGAIAGWWRRVWLARIMRPSVRASVIATAMMIRVSVIAAPVT